MKRIIRSAVSVLLLFAILATLVPKSTVFAGYNNGYTGGRHGDGVGIYAHGVDLSEWQGGSVDFQKIKAQGYSFVILRAGFSVYIDEYFERNYAAAKEAGLHVGVYLYSYAETVEKVLREAEALKGWLKGKTLEYPVYYDMEEPETHGKMSPEALTELSMAFLDAMASEGWLVGLYSCKSWLDGKLETNIICKQYECWMAMYLSSGSYATYDRYDEQYGMWQYSSTGKVDGVPGNVDMNIAFKDYPSICMDYGFNGYTASGENLALVGAAEIPKVISHGETIRISGRVVSKEGKLNNVTVGIYDLDGNLLTGRSAGPKTDSYDISELANGVKISELSEGTYIYRVSATNSKRTKVLLQQQLTVSRAGILALGVTPPKDLKEGTKYIPQGEIQASTALREVRIEIFDQDVKLMADASVEPNETAYALPLLANALQTQNLKLGEYIYKVTARTTKGEEVILEEGFSVWVADDPIVLKDHTLKSEYHLNQFSSLDGTIISEKSDLRNVTVEIFERHNAEPVLFVSAQAGESVSLSKITEGLAFDALSYGSYLCRISATNDSGPAVLLQKSFIIRPDGLSLCDFSAPETIVKGDSFLISGALASDDTPIKFVSVTVLDEQMQVLLDASVSVNVMVYNLADLAPKLAFSSLQNGKYRLKVSAQNGSDTEVLYNGAFRVTSETDVIKWKNYRYFVYGISLSCFDSLQLNGTIESSESDIINVRAEVFEDGGTLVNSAEISPMSKTAEIDRLNDALRISALPAGCYKLVITAENASDAYVLTDDIFTISACAHRNVRTGETYGQRCDRIGAICDSRCADCGERVRYGTSIAADAHSLQDGSCVHCGEEDMQTVSLMKSQGFSHNGRYLLAYFDGQQWFALDMWGNTVPIAEPYADGELSVSAQLLWTPLVHSDGMRFVNPFGYALHVDSGGISVACGSANTVLKVTYTDGFACLTNEANGRSISFENAVFCCGEKSAAIYIFELPLKSK